jgi:hypothetical protein
MSTWLYKDEYNVRGEVWDSKNLSKDDGEYSPYMVEFILCWSSGEWETGSLHVPKVFSHSEVTNEDLVLWYMTVYEPVSNVVYVGVYRR